VFFLFVFGYGALRFLLELWRDDVERGAYGPTIDKHVYVPLCLLLMAVGFAYGISLGITHARARMVARVLAFVPPVVAYLMLKPPSFAQTIPYQLSTSQLIGLLSALVVCYFYASFWEEARKNPTLSMSLGDPVMIRELRGEEPQAEQAEEDEDDEADEEDEAEEAAPAKAAKSGKGKKKGLVPKGAKKAEEEPKEEPEGKGEPEPGTT